MQKALAKFILTTIAFLGLYQSKAQICVEIITPKPAVLTSELFTAIVVVHGKPKSTDIIVSAWGLPLEVISDSAYYRATGSAPGEFTVHFEIEVKTDTGVYYYEERSLTYLVLSPMAYINADEGNVLYAGLQNLISVSVPGANPSNVFVAANYGTLTSIAAGKYHLMISNQDEPIVKVMVSAKINGRVISMGTKSFRVVPIPKPEIQFVTYSDSLGKIRYRPLLKFEMGGALRYYPWKITNWELSVFHKNVWNEFYGNSASLTFDAAKLLGELEQGDFVVLQNVKVETDSELGKVSSTGSIGFAIK